jgi:glycerophosphoryl diester phosphodiesterase
MSGPRLAADQLVAHRGWPARFPENTILGVSAAIGRGATWIEVDVQLTSDGVPVLFHDESLKRSCGQKVRITQISIDALPSGSAAFPKQFGDRYADTSIDRLARLGPLLSRNPQVRVFVELKTESAMRHGHDTFFAAVDSVLRSFELPEGVTTVISKDQRLCQMAQTAGWPIGWVLPKWDDASRRIAEPLAAEYLFCNVGRLPCRDTERWPGPWKWIAYTVNDADRIAEWLACGMQLVETDDIGLLG